MTLVARNLTLPGRLERTDFALEPASLTALVGPNGSGKTSLLRGLAGIAGSADTLSIAGEDLRAALPPVRARMLAYLPASRQVDWAIPVRDLLRLNPVELAADRFDRLVERLDLAPFLDRAANALSTGERARMLFARALASEARYLLLDEPLANLDPYWVLTMGDMLREEAAQGRGVAIALHDLQQLAIFERLVLMKDGQIVADGPRSELEASGRIADLFDLTLGPDGRLRL